MTDHVRTQIRNAAVAALTGLPTAGSRVFARRLSALREPDLPCLLVNTDGERIEAITVHSPSMLERSMRLAVRGVAMDDDRLDDTLDTLAADVETALGDTTLGGLAKSVLLDTVEIEAGDELQYPAGVISLNYNIIYMTSATAPTSAI